MENQDFRRIVNRRTVSNSASPSICFKCKKPEHAAKNCRFVQPTCFKCSVQGHETSKSFESQRISYG